MRLLKLPSLVIIFFLLSGCFPKVKEGEAFLVLKSDQIIPLADMQIVFLPKSFRTEFSSLQASFSQDRAQQLTGLLLSSPEAQKSLDEFDARIRRLELLTEEHAEISTEEIVKINNKTDELVDVRLIELKTALDEARSKLNSDEEVLSQLEQSAATLFQEVTNKIQDQLTDIQSDLRDIIAAINEFDITLSNTAEAIDSKNSDIQKAENREMWLHTEVSRLLNQAIRQQRLQTPLLDESKFRIKSKIDRNARLDSRPSNYLATLSTFAHINIELQRVFDIPDELLKAKNMTTIMDLVREQLTLVETISKLKVEYNELLERRSREAQPWINLNGEKIQKVATIYSIRVRPDNNRRISTSPNWHPELYRLAIACRNHLSEQTNIKKLELDALDFDKFKEKHIAKIQSDVSRSKDQLERINIAIADIDNFRQKILQSLLNDFKSNSMKEVNSLKNQLTLTRLQRERFINELTEDSLEQIKEKFRIGIEQLISRSMIGETRTDMRGKFAIPRKARFVWARRIRDIGEDIFWLREVQSDSGSKMLLSNSSISGNEDLINLINKHF